MPVPPRSSHLVLLVAPPVSNCPYLELWPEIFEGEQFPDGVPRWVGGQGPGLPPLTEVPEWRGGVYGVDDRWLSLRAASGASCVSAEGRWL